MKRLLLLALLLGTRVNVSRGETRAWVNAEGNLEFCETEIFEVQCEENEVILMETARYGRMQYGHCIERDYGFLGCYADVLHLADRWCSGRRACRIPVPNSAFRAASSCPKDLTPYLEASYICTAVHTAEAQSCESSNLILPADPRFGYLANYITIETQKGSEKCPWIIQSKPGQRINITLLDFARTTDDEAADYDVCRTYAVIHQGNPIDSQQIERVCGGGLGPRERTVYSTLSNRVEISISEGSSPDKSEYFLFRYEVLGCETPDDLPFMEKQMQDELRVVYGCQATGQTWTLVCSQNQWQGEVGNCSEMLTVTVATVSPSFVDTLLNTLSLSFEYSLLVVISIAVAIGILIVICGVCCVRRNQKPRRSRQAMQKPIQAVQPTSKPVSKMSGDYRKLTESGDIKIKCDGEKLPPPPPELLVKDGSEVIDGQNGSITYDCITAKMPTPPPSPTAPPVSPRTDSTSTLSTTCSYPSNKRSVNTSAHMHGVHTMPVKARLGSNSSHPRSPQSAGYCNRNSFEFPPPPPEVLRNAGYPQGVPSSAPPTMHKPFTELPDHDIIRYRIVDPRQDPYKKYGTLGNKVTTDRMPDPQGRMNARQFSDLDSQQNASVPYEYGYHLKTGQKFKIYQPLNSAQRSPYVQPREERNRKMQSVASSSPASSAKLAKGQKQQAKTGTM